MRNVMLLLLVLPFMVLGQNKCMSDEYNATKAFSHNRSTIPADEVDLESHYIINIVFHILYKSGDDVEDINVSDDDIDYAIASLNRDFNLRNGDTTILTDTLKRLPGNMNIEFELATIDPDGNPTNGITRTETNIDFFSYFDDGAKFDSLGGKDAWDTKRYFNVWACQTQNGLIGYSQFPGGDESTDGVVILYDVVKEKPNKYPQFSKGRVLAHEIGHSLSLRHPWGNGWGCGDNLVDDIPTQNGPNYNCHDTIFSICYGDTFREVVKHYMDYCGDGCMVMFTKGQVFNARESIQQHRMDLVTIKKEEPVEEKIGDIKMFPTINTGRLFIDLNNRFPDQILTFNLYDMANRLIQSESIMGGIRNDLRLKLHTNGLYSVVLFKGDDIIYKDRIIFTREVYNKIKGDEKFEELLEEENER